MKTDTFKIGDKVKCIKTFIGVNNTIFYNENNYYYIKNIRKDTYEIPSNYDIPLSFNLNQESVYYINNFFIPIKQERKLKLDKIAHQTR